MKGPFGAALLSAFLLSGCVGSPTIVPLARKIEPQALGLGADAAPRSSYYWWKTFNDPQIDQLAMNLLRANPTLQGAMARIRAAEAELSASQSTNYPQVVVDGSAQGQLLSGAYIYAAPYGGSYISLGDVEAKMEWSLDFWGKQAAQISKARNTALAAALDADAARLALAGALSHAYMGLLLAYQIGDIAEQTVAERQTIVELTQTRLAAGLDDEAALQQAKALLALADSEVSRSRTQREIAIHAIAALIGQGAAGYAQITRPALTLDATLPLPATLPADLLSRRADILASRARIEVATEGRIAARADFYPNIDLRAAAGVQGIGLRSLFAPSALVYSLGPAIHLPIFDAGKVRAQYADATAALDVAIADYNEAVVEAVRQTSDALTLVQSLDSQRSEQQIALDSATRAFNLAKERYRLGLSGQIPMLIAENTLLHARQQMAELIVQTAIERVTLFLSIGGGFTSQDADKMNRRSVP